MKKLFPLVFLALIVFPSSAQWTSKAAFPGIARAKAVSFAIGDTVYVMGGVTNSNLILKDFWKYDMNGNAWTQVPDFPGEERYGAASFVLANTGYIATGGNDNGYLDDMWQYDPATSNWLQRTGLPAGSAQHENQRAEAYAFVINNKAYLGGGNGWVFGANSTNPIAFTDLWEWNPGTNTWSTKASVPDVGKNFSVAGVINDKAYIGLGCDAGQTTNFKTFWEYDPAGNAWTAMSQYPTNFTVDAGSFVWNNELYVVGGVDLSSISLTNAVHKYDPVNDAWTQIASYSGGSVAGQFIASNGSRVFSGGGYNGSIVTRNDLWEFTTTATGVNYDLADYDDGLDIFPNPATTELNLVSEKEIKSWEVLDISGRTVKQNTDIGFRINLEGISAGTYFLKYVFDDGKAGVRRFMVERQ